MASPITPSTGLGSGLAIGDIVTALVNSDKLAKQTQITTQTKLVTTKLSGIGTLQSALSAFQTLLKPPTGTTSKLQFAGYAATSSDATKVSVTSDNSAVPGTHTVVVNKVATSSSVATAAFAGDAKSSAIPTGGSLTVSQNGIGKTYTIADGDTLASVAKQINADTKTTGISANIITDTNGSRLVFGSTATGAGSDITTTSGITGLQIDAGVPVNTTSASSAGYIGAQPIDADVTIDGFNFTSKSNTIDKNLGGVSLTLLPGSDKSTAPVTVTVATNTDGLKASLQAFVDSYNSVVKAVSTVTKATVSATPDPTTGATVTPAALTGDSMPRSILSALRNELVTTGAGGDLSVLSQLGITTAQADGTLSLDSTKFDAAMSKGLAGDVQTLFSGTGDGSNGLIARMNNAITPYTQTGGIFATRTTSLNKQQSDLQDQQTALDLRVTTLTATLTAKYNAMDLLVGQLKASATSITSFFDSLNASKG
ncbi:flagellar filament capping protein FliD [Pseudomonas sp. SLFW]|uniref:flagellar filament capping protein FliD n=1 Tax=Pseudomonas sp. SLFW TaxID=2683259 RepID=UPI001411C713|nr:flagellar filament capping protein FliD [Pseudomonas sp. SLFW]NBB12902.1 flagellar filament capping protein FliD [Pseudomonas sp. SLFW]